MKLINISPILALFFVSVSYAQILENLPEKPIVHTVYATGNLGTLDNNDNNSVLKAISTAMNSESNDHTMLLLGNNGSELGLSNEESFGRENMETYISDLMPFADNLYFIPGASDWKYGVKYLKAQEDYLRNTFNRSVFLPERGCPIEKVSISSSVDLLILDSQWALSDWDKIPNINDNCHIKNKTEFYVEVEHEIVKSQGKTVLIAVYHPIVSYGKYGNSYSFGMNPQNKNNKHYKEFSARLMTIAQQSTNVIFLSSHEQNLQHIVSNGIPIIVSGAGGAITKSYLGKKSKFYYNQPGFSKLTEFEDGSIWVSYYGVSNNFTAPIFSTEIIPPAVGVEIPDYKEEDTPQTVSKSIYQPGELDRTGFFKMLWGKHYREDYKTPVTIKAALLDTLYGGLSVIRKGGGHQTNSLRLQTKDGREFTMRSAKKSALRFIQYFIFKTEYLDSDVEDNYFIQLLQDYWTTANPYGSLTIGDLADAIDVYHSNTELYYVPKQKALDIYNLDYGDKIYFIEERLTDGHKNVKSLGNTNEIIGTSDLFEILRRKDKIQIDESRYIRSRLFDNILGDFDRHEDQWRWAVQKQDNGIDIYQPIPRDRDQAFSDFDGFMLGALTTLSPPLRFMQRYDESYGSVKWMNDAGDDVDMAVLINHTREDWLREARYIKENLTEEVIDNAFQKFPKEIDQTKIANIKKALLGRIDGVEENASDFYDFLRSNVLITGTDKEDYFIITRQPNGITNVSIYRIKGGAKADKYWDVDYDTSDTRELWIYGLDDEDVFEVSGQGDKYIKIKIIGGQNNDTYIVNNKRNLRVFDQKSKPNTFNTSFPKTLSDNYDLNTYYFKKGRKDIFQTIPVLGFDPDDGLGLGVNLTYTKNSLQRNPFSAQHNLKAIFYSATSGAFIDYNGEFANIFDKINLGIEARFNTPRFTNNFFGFGNQTLNPDDVLDFDFNRVRIKQLSLSPSLIFRGYQGSIVKLSVSYQNVKVEETENRFVDIINVNPMVFVGQDIYGAEVSYAFENFDNAALPKNGFGFKIASGYKTNFDEKNSFGYVIPEIRLTTKIDKKGILVFATKLKAQLNLGNDFEFYQAATIGDGDGLRGFRQQRFSGNQSFYQNSDLRLSLGKLRNSLIPITFGIYAGFDYGRVWVDNEDSTKWHNSPGAGLYFNIAGFTTANIAYFSSEEGGRLNIGLSLAF